MRGDFEKLCLTLLLLYQTSASRPGQFLDTADPVIAVAGEDVVLPCYFKPSISAENMHIEWVRPQSDNALVHLYQQRENRNEHQIPSYRGRTALSSEKLKEGNASLRLTRVQVSDEGGYTCFVQSESDVEQYSRISITLEVRAVGVQPIIFMEGQRHWGVGLLCECRGWYPQPELILQDSEGNSLIAGHTETYRDNLNLFIMRQYITIQDRDIHRITCRVLQRKLDQEKEAEFEIPAEVTYYAQGWKVAALFLIAFVVIICALLFNLHKKLRRKEEELSRNLDKVSAEKEWISKLLDMVSPQNDIYDMTEHDDFENVHIHAVGVTLDPDTANPWLTISEDRKQVRTGGDKQDLPETPLRMTVSYSVLGTNGFTEGKHYWEVQVGNEPDWVVGVVREDINRKTRSRPKPSSGFWTLRMGYNHQITASSDPCIPPNLGRGLSKVGVYVDYEGGRVSFYNVETRSHIYTFTEKKFDKKLYPYFSPNLYFSDDQTQTRELIISPVL